MKWLLWLLRGKPMIHYDGYNCGCCGKWWNIEFDVSEYKSLGKWWDTWGLCPKNRGCGYLDGDKK